MDNTHIRQATSHKKLEKTSMGGNECRIDTITYSLMDEENQLLVTDEPIEFEK